MFRAKWQLWEAGAIADLFDFQVRVVAIVIIETIGQISVRSKRGAYNSAAPSTMDYTRRRVHKVSIFNFENTEQIVPVLGIDKRSKLFATACLMTK